MRMPGRKAHSWRSSSWICRASSRVGARMRPVTSVPSGSVCSTMGMPKAKVLPDPVGALAMTSFQSLKQGMAPACTGVARVKPFWSSAFRMPWERFISLYRRSTSTSMPLISIKQSFARRAKAGGSHSNTLIQGIIYHNRRQVARGEGRSFKGELPAGGLGQRRAPRGGRLRGAEGVGIRGPPAVLPGA